MTGGERIKTLIAVNLDETIQNGDKRPKTPLNITLLPPFKHDLSAVRILNRSVERIGKQTAPFTVTGLGIEYFGENNDIAVRKVGGQTLSVIHNKLVSSAQLLPRVMLDMTYAGENYSPHATFTDDDVSIAEGEERQVSEIWLMRQHIETSPSGARQKLWTMGPSIPLEGK